MQSSRIGTAPSNQSGPRTAPQFPRVLVLCLGLLASQGLFAGAKQAHPTLEDFCAGAAIADPQLSPDGKLLAYLAQVDGRMALALFHVDTGKASVLAQPDSDIGGFFWKGNGKIIYSGIGAYATLVRLDLVTHEAKQIVGYGTVSYTARVMNTLPLDPQHIIAETAHIGLLDVDTGLMKIVEPENVRDTIYNYRSDGAGILRIRYRFTPGVVELQHRRTNEEIFRTVYQWKIEAPWVQVIGFGRDPDIAFVTTFDDGDLGVLHGFNTKTGAMGPAVAVGRKGAISHGVFSSDGTRLLGVRIEADDATCQWLDPRMQRLQAQLDASFPGKLVTLASFSGDESVVVVRVSSPSDPGRYLLLDTRRGVLQPLGKPHPQIDPSSLGRVSSLDLKASDGFTFHAYLTEPAGGGGSPHPLVLMPQQDIFSGRWLARYDPFTQYLASLGYSVLEVDTRGAWGYGHQYSAAGKQQLAGRVPGDLEDAARWAVESRHAVPGRICILGRDFGATMALIEATHHPELFCCCVNINGEPELALFAKNLPLHDWLDQERLRDWIGTDEKAMEALSAVKAVDRLSGPVFNDYWDANFNQTWGRLESALKRAKKDYALRVPLHDEAHKLHAVDYRLDDYRQIADFLKLHLSQ